MPPDRSPVSLPPDVRCALRSAFVRCLLRFAALCSYNLPSGARRVFRPAFPLDGRCASRPVPDTSSARHPVWFPTGFRCIFRPMLGVLCVRCPDFARPSACDTARVRIRSFSVPPTWALTALRTPPSVPRTPHPHPVSCAPARCRYSDCCRCPPVLPRPKKTKARNYPRPRPTTMNLNFLL